METQVEGLILVGCKVTVWEGEDIEVDIGEFYFILLF